MKIWLQFPKILLINFRTLSASKTSISQQQLVNITSTQYFFIVINNINFSNKLYITDMRTKPKQPIKTIKYFSVGKNNKPKKISNQQIKSPNCSGIDEVSMIDKSDQDVKWLEKLVNGFEWYRIKKDTLFDDEIGHNENKESFRKNMKNCFGRALRQSSGMMRKNSHRCNQSSGKGENNDKEPLKNNSKIINSVRTAKKNPNANNKLVSTHRIQKTKAKVEPQKKQVSKNSANQQQCENNQKENQLSGTKKIENNQSQTEGLKSNYNKTFRKKDESGFGKIVKNNKSVDQRKFYAHSQHKNAVINGKQNGIVIDTPITQGVEKQRSGMENTKAGREARNRTIQQLKKQLNFNRYEYYANHAAPVTPVQDYRNNRLQEKKHQRKLNSSIGNCRNTNKKKQCAIEQTVDKPAITDPKKQQKNISLSELITEENQNQQNPRKSQKGLLESLPQCTFKYAVSTRNSALMTQQNSYVIEKISEEQHYSQPMQLPATKTNSQWDIIGIFNKLDRKNLKILNSNNCSIESLSRELRYILGGVLEQILYTQMTMDLDGFIMKVQDLLNTNKYMEFRDSNEYFELKQLAAETQRKTIQVREQPKISPEEQTAQYRSNKFKFMDINKSQKKQEKSIRFATFQNQSDEEADTKFIVPHQRIKEEPIHEFKNNLGLQLDLQKRLSQLNELKLCGNIAENRRTKQKTMKTQQVCQQSLQIQKLEQLNRKIQKYLIDQSINSQSHTFLE